MEGTPPAEQGFRIGDAAALTLQFSPFEPEYFLAGFSDGDVALFHVAHTAPLKVWPASMESREAVLRVRWSPHRPSVFYVLTVASRLQACIIQPQLL